MPAYPALLDPTVDSFKVMRESINSMIGAISVLEAAGVVSHNHSGADINAGEVPFAYLPTGATASDVAIGNHNHDGDYHPLIGSPNTGFNLALGITAGTVSEGNHTHSANSITSDTFDAARLPASGVSAAAYTNADITVDAYGRVTAAANGASGGGMSTFTLRDDSDADWVVSDSDFIKYTTTADLSITKGSGTGTTGDPYDLDFAIVSAPKWTTARTVSVRDAGNGNSAMGSVNLDGTADQNLDITINGAGHSHTGLLSATGDSSSSAYTWDGQHEWSATAGTPMVLFRDPTAGDDEVVGIEYIAGGDFALVPTTGGSEYSALRFGYDHVTGTPTNGYWYCQAPFQAEGNIIMATGSSVAHHSDYYGTAAHSTELSGAPVGAIYYQHEA